MEAISHYGEAIITAQKKAGAYGSVFSYEQYQFLHSCETIEQFQEWLASTDFSDSIVFTEIEPTYEYLICSMALTALTKSSRSGKAICFKAFGSPWELPILLLMYLMEKHQIHTLKSKQKSLLKKHQKLEEIENSR